MTFDETELIEFFGVLPSEQNAQEQEFFGATIFDVIQNDHHLSISFSPYYNDFQLYLRATSLQEPLLEIRLEGVVEIKVRRDKANSIPTLLIKTAEKNEGVSLGKMDQTLSISLQPNLNVSLLNRSV